MIAVLAIAVGGIATIGTSDSAWSATASELNTNGLGHRVVSVRVKPIRPASWVTVGLHPTDAPIELGWNSDDLEVCPATVDGTLLAEWPASGFAECLSGGSQDRATLPATDGNFHVAFAVRNRSRRSAPLRLQITYDAQDSFVEVIAPVGADGSVAFVPASITVGVQPFELPSYARPSGVVVTVRQGARTLTVAGECTFGSEIERCLRGVDPGRSIIVMLRRTTNVGSAVGLYVAWA